MSKLQKQNSYSDSFSLIYQFSGSDYRVAVPFKLYTYVIIPFYSLFILLFIQSKRIIFKDERLRLLEIENSRKAAKSATIETPPHSVSPATVAPAASTAVPIAANKGKNKRISVCLSVCTKGSC